MKLTIPLLSAALILSAGLAAFAGTAETVTFTATVPSVLELTTTTNSAGVTIVSGDYTTDAITTEAAAANQLAVRSNRAWVIGAKSGAASFTFTPSVTGDTRTKPSTDLAVRKASGTYQTLSTTNVTLASGARGGNAVSGNTFDVDYRFASDISFDPPGTYVLDVVYTLTAP